MEFASLNFALNHLASTGTAFSVEHAMAMQASLVDMCKMNSFYNVYFWGKIQGTENDYYIAYGVGKDFLKERTYYYSMNHSLEWVQLIEPTPLTIDLALASTGRFVGNPEAICETEISANHEDTIDEDGDEEEEGSLWLTFKEEERLAATVSIIQSEAEIIPRGFLIKDPTGSVFQNKAFEGLPKEEALQLISYFHVRQAETPWDKNIVGRPDYNITLDFLQSIANDLPIGCWTISLDNIETVATLRSLFWPGAHGAVVIANNRQQHMCGWGLFSWWYIGTGKKNWDVPFMITPPSSLAKACVVEEDQPQIEIDDSCRTYSMPESDFLIPSTIRNNFVKPISDEIRSSTNRNNSVKSISNELRPSANRNNSIKSISNELRPSANRNNSVKFISNELRPSANRNNSVKSISNELRPSVNRNNSVKSISNALRPSANRNNSVKFITNAR